MSTRAELLALADRREAAEEGSRELDCEIHVAVNGWKLLEVGPDFDGKNNCAVFTPGGRRIDGFHYPTKGVIHPYYHVPPMAYTVSIDGALELLAVGCRWKSELFDTHARFVAFVRCDDDHEYEGDHPGSFPLALCAAALRARASLLMEGGPS